MNTPDHIRISNLLSSIVWTAEKLQEMHSYNASLAYSGVADKLQQIETQLDLILDYEETHI